MATSVASLSSSALHRAQKIFGHPRLARLRSSAIVALLLSGASSFD